MVQVLLEYGLGVNVPNSYHRYTVTPGSGVGESVRTEIKI